MEKRRIRLPFIFEAIALLIIPFEEALALSFGSVLRIINVFNIFIAFLFLLKEWKKPVFFIKGPLFYLFIFIVFNIVSIVWIYNKTLYFDSLATFVLYGVLMLVLLNLQPTSKEKNLMLKGLYIGGLLVCILTLFSHNVVDLGDREAIALFGRYIDPNVMSFSVTITSIINFNWIISGSKKIFAKIVLALIQATTIFSIVALGSRGCMLSLAAAIFVALVIRIAKSKNKVRNFSIAAAVLLSLILFYFFVILPSPFGSRFTIDNLVGKGENGSANRLTIWGAAIEAFTKKPLLGYGCGSSPFAIEIFYKYYGTHNLYLRILVELGIVGMIIFLFWFLSLFQNIRKKGSLYIMMTVSLLVFNVFIEGLSTKVFWGLILFLTFVAYQKESIHTQVKTINEVATR